MSTTTQDSGIGNVLRDGVYVTPWGAVERCFVITDYKNPPAMQIVRGKCGAEVHLEHQETLRPSKTGGISTVESRYVFFGTAPGDVVAARRESWPQIVLNAVPAGIENAKSAKELAALLGCGIAHLKAPLQGAHMAIRNGCEVYYLNAEDTLCI